MSTGDDRLLLGLAVAAALAFAALLLRSRALGEVTWVLNTTRRVSLPESILIGVEISNAGAHTAAEVAVWTSPHPTGPRLELKQSTVRAGQCLLMELEIPVVEWERMWLAIHWRSRRAHERPLTTSYHLATRTPPCAGLATKH